MRPDYNSLEAFTRPRRTSARWISLACALLFVGLLAAQAHAAVGVILNESLDTSVARITGSGHSAVYLSNVCPETVIKLRLCHEGEQGSVISNYTTLGEDQPYEWNVVPLSVYLYGVENPDHRPLFGSPELKRLLEERYRDKHLAEYCESESCRTSNKAEWREMVGATLSRSLYMFVVETARDQDVAFINDFNSAPNENHFNGMTRNCADFTRRIVNSYFPHATKGDPINDFGMTSPKAVARSFSHYADRHPAARFRVYHFAQLPGAIRRSTPARTGTEQLYRSKKLLLPMLLFAPHELPVFAASYVLTGRFNPQRELEQHPTIAATEAGNSIRLAKDENDYARARRLEEVESEDRARALGTEAEWKQYSWQLDSMVDDAISTDVIPGREYLTRALKRLDEAGRPVIEDSGALWLESTGSDRNLRVGLSASNILASGSDPQLAYGLMLAHASYVLRSPKHSQETMAQFRKDWQLVKVARSRSSAIAADADHLLPEEHRLAAVSGGR